MKEKEIKFLLERADIYEKRMKKICIKTQKWFRWQRAYNDTWTEINKKENGI